MRRSRRNVRRTVGKRRKRLHGSDKRQRCEGCSTFLCRYWNGPCQKCGFQNVVKVEAEVAALRSYEGSRTEINNPNMAGSTAIAAGESINWDFFSRKVGSENVANVETEVVAHHSDARSCTEMNDSNMDGIEIEAVEIGNRRMNENDTATSELSRNMDLDYTSDSENSFTSAEEIEEAEVILWCYNCHRVLIQPAADMGIDLELHPIYEVLLSMVSLERGSF